MALLALALTASHAFAQNSEKHTVRVNPYDKKIHAIAVGPNFYGDLHVVPASPKHQDIVHSEIATQSGNDGRLWYKYSSDSDLHIYTISDAFPGTEFVSIKGEMTVTQPGSGGSGPTPLLPFQFTVPEVDVDWTDFSDPSHEVGEDTRIISIKKNDIKRFIVRRPVELNDGMALPVPKRIPDMTLTIPAGLPVYLTHAEALAGDESKAIDSTYKVKKEVWQGSGSGSQGAAAVEFFVKRSKSRNEPGGELTIRLEREPTPYDETSARTYDVIKCALEADVMLKKVSFLKSHSIKSDNGALTFTAPQWEDNSNPLDGDAEDKPDDKKYPVCYTRDQMWSFPLNGTFPHLRRLALLQKSRGWQRRGLFSNLPRRQSPAQKFKFQTWKARISLLTKLTALTSLK